MPTPILRTKCDFNWTTPFGASRLMPINCASSNTDTWPWKYWWTKTVGTASPVSTSAVVQSSASLNQQGNADLGQTVLRGFFAYVATDPISASVSLSVSATPAWSFEGETYQLAENISLVAALYSANGSQVASYIDTNSRTASQSIELPATICPKVLWLNASIQPTGTPPEPPLEPSTEANITFSAG